MVTETTRDTIGSCLVTDIIVMLTVYIFSKFFFNITIEEYSG